MAFDRSLSAYLMIGHVVFTITAERLEILVFFSRSRVRFEAPNFRRGRKVGKIIRSATSMESRRIEFYCATPGRSFSCQKLICIEIREGAFLERMRVVQQHCSACGDEVEKTSLRATGPVRELTKLIFLRSGGNLAILARKSENRVISEKCGKY
jgi:hypothetical protein